LSFTTTAVSGGNATWQGYVNAGRTNWNNATGANITVNANSTNSVSIVNPDDTWFGLYTGHAGTNGAFSRFTIQINQRAINEANPTNLANFVTSVATHEFGHALRLGDNPPVASNRSIMRSDRNRNSLFRPTNHDIAWLAARPAAAAATQSFGSEVIGSEEESILIASYPEYADSYELTHAADIVISGNVITASTTSLDSFGTNHPYTVYSVEVMEVISGNIMIGDVIEVKQLGTEASPERSTNYLEAGQKCLLFLASYDDSPYSVLNPVQGQYTVDQKGNIIAHEENEIEISSVGSVARIAKQVTD
jgi:hypothetical protein